MTGRRLDPFPAKNHSILYQFPVFRETLDRHAHRAQPYVSTMRILLEHLRKTVSPVDLTDGELLERYVRHRAEGAFEALVRRHGPMVLGVCRRVLRNVHDAEDAFQATWVVLVRKAASILPRERLSSWLYGVAYLAALKMRAATAKRRAKELERPRPSTVSEGVWHDLEPLLDQELSRLPDRERLPLVLCELQGLTRKQAARQLGWPEGTVAGRLARGRALLAKRLTKLGLPFSSGMLAAVLSENAALASVPPSLVVTTVQAATALASGTTAASVSPAAAATAKGVIHAMLWNKLKVLAAMVLVVLALLGAGMGALSQSGPDAALAQEPGEQKSKEATKAAARDDVSKRLAELEKQVESLTRELQSLRKKKAPPPRPETKSEVKIFHLRHADAIEVAKALRELFPTGLIAGPPALRITTYEKSILVLGPTDDLEMIEVIILNLDRAAPKKEPAKSTR